MEWAGPLIGMPFSLEGFAFFTEAIFLGIYLYGWDRVGRRAHWFAGWMVALSGILSGIFVVMANAWMNQPTGFDLVDGEPVNMTPSPQCSTRLLRTDAAHDDCRLSGDLFCRRRDPHSSLAREPGSEFHRKAIAIALSVGVIAAAIQPLAATSAPASWPITSLRNWLHSSAMENGRGRKSDDWRYPGRG